MAAVDPKEFLNRLDRGQFSPLVLLHGEEVFFMNEVLTKIKEKVLDNSLIDFNFSVYYASDCDPSQVGDNIETLPMMAAKRLVIIKSAEDFSASELDQFLKYIENPIETTVLVFVAEKIDMRKKFFKTFDSKGTVIKFAKPYENQVGPWIQYIAKKHGKTLGPDAVEFIKQWVGTNLIDINNEILKVSQYVGSKTNLEVSDLQAVVSRTRVNTVFELANCIGRRDCSAALVHLAHLLESGQNEVGVVAIIVRHFRILMLIQEALKEGLSQPQISARVGVHGFFIKEYLDQAKQLTADHLIHVLDVLLDTDRALKSNPISSHIWLENLVIQSCIDTEQSSSQYAYL